MLLDQKDNAAQIYAQASAWVDTTYEKGFPDMLQPIQDAVGDARPATGALANKRIAELKPLFDLLEKAAEKPGCDLELNYALGPEMRVPEFTNLKNFVTLLVNRAVLEDRARAPLSRTIHWLHRAAQISAHLGQEPVFAGLFVQLSCDALIRRAINFLSSSTPRAASEIELLKRVLDEIDPELRPTLVFYVRGEAVSGRISTQTYTLDRMMDLFSRDGSEGTTLKFPIPANVSDETQRKAFEARFLAMVRSAFEEFQALDNLNPRAVGDAMDRVVGREEQMMYQDGTHVMNTLLFPSFGQAASAMIRRDASHALLQVKLELLAKYGAHGTFPAKLDYLPMDPFSDDALRYRRTKAGFVLYSVGPDHQDNGGVPGTRNDIVVDHPLSFSMIAPRGGASAN